jgi:virginiamycin B lyase
MIPAMRRLVPIVVLTIIALACSGGTATAALEAIQLREGGEIQALRAGPEGKLWFAGVDDRGETPSNFVGWLAPTGEKMSYSIATPAGTAGIADLIPGPGGDMWFTVPAADRIEAIDTAGEGRAFPLPAGSRPTGLVASGGIVWAALEGTGQITALNPETAMTSSWSLGHGLPAPSVRPTAMVLGPDDALWALQAESVNLTRMTLQGGRSSIALTGTEERLGASGNSDIAAGADGSLWVGQSDRATIAKLVPASGSANYSGFAVPGGPTTLLSAGPAGDIWFADEAGKIGSIAPAGEVGEPACGVGACEAVTALARGPEGKLWVATAGTIAPFEPRPLRLRIDNVDGRIRTGGLFMRIKCRGGAAGQRCPGRIELRNAGRRIQGSPYRALTGSFDEVTLPLSGRAKELLARAGRLRVVLLLSVAGKTTDRRVFTLRAAR